MTTFENIIDEIHDVTENLSITSLAGVEQNDTSGFDVVVSVCQDTCEANVSDDTEYLHFSLADGPESARNWGGSYSYDDFAEAADAVLDSLNDGKRVLVHCHSGQNRSAAICIAALAVRQKDRGLHRAYSQVLAARAIIDPNQHMFLNATHYLERNFLESLERVRNVGIDSDDSSQD